MPGWSTAGFRSALLEANGAEPAVTWPSGLEGPAIDTDGEPSCLDYIWLRGPVGVEAARVVFDRPAVDDPGLLPSDHFGLSATCAGSRGMTSAWPERPQPSCGWPIGATIGPSPRTAWRRCSRRWR